MMSNFRFLGCVCVSSLGLLGLNWVLLDRGSFDFELKKFKFLNIRLCIII